MLPDGYTWRPATPDDAEAILSLVTVDNLATIGFVDYTLDDARDDLAEPGFTPATDSWLVHDAGGTVIGYGWAIARGTGEKVDVEAISPDDAVLEWLYDRVLDRATELAHAGGHPANFHQGIFRADTRTAAAAAKRGFARATTFHRMRVDHGEVADPVAPPGVTLRTGPGDEDFRRTAHAVLTESFKDHFGSVAQSYEQWREGLELESTFDWPQLTLADLDGRPVAILLTLNGYIETDNCGYVADLGVLPEARGRGIAKYLLRTAFATDARAGRTGTLLHVDTNNTTPALGLYESVGMRPILIIDMWCRTADLKESTSAAQETARSPGRS